MTGETSISNSLTFPAGPKSAASARKPSAESERRTSWRDDEIVYIINAFVNYAVKCMIVLAQSKHPVWSGKLAEVVGTSQRYVLHICSRLRDSGIISARYGKSGGYVLLLNPAEITLMDVIDALCFDPTIAYRSCTSNPVFAKLENHYDSLNTLVMGRLKSVTLAELL